MRRRWPFGAHRRANGDETATPEAPEPPRSALAAAVEARRATVERELAAAAGGASLCSISRSGGAVDGVKYLEGRQAMLSELVREMRSAPGTEGAVLAEIAQAWRAALGDAVRRDLGGGWVAYRAGGTDEADELLSAHRDPQQDERDPR